MPTGDDAMTDTTHEASAAPVALPATMRAATYHHYGPPEQVVTVTEVPLPELGPADVLVKVGAASVNALDWHYVSGLPMFARPTLGWLRPHRTIPGADIAGTIAAVGATVTRFRVGDEVFGQVDGGGFAEYAVTPADWLVARPPTVSRDDAATLGVAAETALQGLRDWGRLKPGQRVMINGASGGVGTFAVQLAKALGAAHVTAVCSTPNVETAARIGADRVVDYTREDATDTTDRYDVLFDNAGVWPLRSCGRLLTDGGRYVMVTSPKSRWVKPMPRMIANVLYFALASGRSAGFKVASRSTPDLELVSELAERGAVHPVISRRFALDEAPEALRVQGEFHARGKSLVVP
jgi:NADPH:quinone reductase-like Zn-dependent oxidoreductase